MPNKKILTIDFNIIMYPCIQLYSNINDSNNYINWEILQRQLNINNFLGYDAKTLELLMLIVHNAYKNNIPIISTQNQKNLIDLLMKNQDETDNEKNIYDITNVDFFADICINNDNIVECDSFNKYHNYDWLHYLYIKNKVNNITWVKAPNSTIPQDNDLFNNILSLSNLADLNITDYDEIYLSLSPNIVPYNFHHLFTLLKIGGDIV